LKNFFEQLGFSRLELSEEYRGARVTVSAYRSKAQCPAKLRRDFCRLQQRRVQPEIRRLLPADWQDTWKENIRPFALTRKFLVVPVWHAGEFKPDRRRPVFIETTFAFGTGLHETTRFMARIIESCRGEFDSFLDVGTGTGILAIVAYFCGADKITALDIEKNSVAAAKLNFKRNGVRGARVLRADFKKVRAVEKTDFVAANLITDDLINLRRKLFAAVKPGGFLAISGVSLLNLPRVEKAFRAGPFKKVKILRGRKWAAILYRR